MLYEVAVPIEHLAASERFWATRQDDVLTVYDLRGEFPFTVLQTELYSAFALAEFLKQLEQDMQLA